ncbi:MAG: hypothetical protein HQL11_02820 [Candidatus Omnitrophica bacterium]|nr:hypothetical protein [Candidatus Omnitrophota bacterium]
MLTSYLRKGLVQGTELLSAAGNRDFVLWGVEDMALYARAIEIYGESAGKRDKALSVLGRLENIFKTLKAELYSPELLSLENLRGEYFSEQISTTDYVAAMSALARQNGMDLDDLGWLQTLAHIQTLERAVDFKGASEEQVSALQAVSPAEREALLEAAAKREYSPFKMSAAAHHSEKGYYTLLKAALNEAGILKNYPALQRYFEYLAV